MIAIPRLLDELRAILPDVSKAEAKHGICEAVALWALVQVAELNHRFSVAHFAKLEQGAAGFRVTCRTGDVCYDVVPAELHQWFDSGLEVVTQRFEKGATPARQIVPYERALALAVASLYPNAEKFERDGSELFAMDRFDADLRPLPRKEKALKEKIRKELTAEAVCFRIWGSLPGNLATVHTDALGAELDRMELP